MLSSFVWKDVNMNAGLVLFKKNGSRKEFPIPSSVTVIGRRQDCDLCIPLVSVSRRHCEINQDQGVLKIRDLKSTNGTYINGQLMKEAELQPGDRIRIGPIVFTLQIDGQPENITMPEPELPPPSESLSAIDKAVIQQDSTLADDSQIDPSLGQSDMGMPPGIDQDIDIN